MSDTSFPDLRTFLDRLRRDGDLLTIEAPVDANLEVAEIHRRVIAAGGKALLFTNVRGSAFPLVTNLFGTRRRVELAFGPRPEQLVREAASLPRELLPPSLSKLWAKRSLFGALAKVGMTRSGHGPVLEVQQDPVRLSSLPATKSWSRDGGRFLTLPLVLTEHPGGHGSNLGVYR